MIKIKQKDFESLKGSRDYGGLYDHVMTISRDKTGTVVWSPDGSVYIRALATAFRNLFNEWTKASNIKTEYLPPDFVPPTNAPAAEPAQSNVDAKIDAVKAEENKALVRLDDWAAKPYGLLLNDYNYQVLRDHFQQNSLPLTVTNIDSAVNTLKDKLQWAIWSTMLRPTEEPGEVLGRLRNGEKQIPLASSEAVLRKASKEQVADWLERTREATNQRYIRDSKSHGVAFVEPTMN
jgi:hypothetical protein